ncbi:aldehyde dehydrogenase family protein [Streptomyces sp. NPDC002521]
MLDAAAAAVRPGGQVMPASSGGSCSLQVRVPLGVIAAFTPRHAPLLMAARAVALPLALGNAVVLKPSEAAPVAGGLLLREVLIEAGLPDGVLTVVTDDADDTDDTEAAELARALVDDRRFRAVTFTGSATAGRQVAVAAARHLKPALIEVGGKNSLLVLGDADVEYAADAAYVSSFLDAGQGCLSTERIFVDRALADDFLARLAEKLTRADKTGPTWPAEVTGAMPDPRAARRVAALVADALAKGATAVTGTGRIEEDTASLGPVVLTDVSADMDIWSQKVSGPVVTVHPVDSTDEAVALAGTPPCGPAAGVITRDWAAGLDVARRLPARAVHVNDRATEPVQAPFGHLTDSGYGPQASLMGIEYFTETRWITAVVSGRPGFPLRPLHALSRLGYPEPRRAGRSPVAK